MGKDNDLIIRKAQGEISNGFNSFEQYLEGLGLPTSGVIADTTERELILTNLPIVINRMSIENKQNATYLSKFVAGCAIGLFDASLNFVWNEVIVSLRNKICIYGIDIFFDAAIGEKVRELYQTEEDLKGVKDQTLLDTCRKLEIISDLLHTKLTYILTMRNDIGASHPNNYSIGSFELLGWLQTCVQEVISDQPSTAAIFVQQLIINLKRSTELIGGLALSQIKESIKELSSSITDNLLRTLFSIFVSPKTGNIVQQNILALAPIAWDCSSDNVKFDLGVKLDQFNVNLNSEAFNLGNRFFEKCDGNMYKTLSTRSLIINDLVEKLLSVHYSWDNFYHEVPVARELLSYIKTPTDIPSDRQEKLIQAILVCRIGNGVSYNMGVSPGAKPLYDTFINLLSSDQIIILIKLLETVEIQSRLGIKNCQQQLVSLLQNINADLLSLRVQEVITFLIENAANVSNVTKTKGFRDITKAFN
ncbi:hypothetical protein [Neobacillus sp. DY30]|uniref:hypothetical protein n=1 Tax=Neobacillus sp. DY30 TaxID=3047871 RepID=UPI0024BF8D81|nr:hypothetical protein [Neobacillus sp. DY30]WHY01325.1 hypothetical protein QNH29_03480 [Neobacillus sp. DY30]